MADLELYCSNTPKTQFLKAWLICIVSLTLGLTIFIQSIDRQAWANSEHPDHMQKNAMSYQDLHGLPLLKQFQAHQQVVKWTCWNYRSSMYVV